MTDNQITKRAALEILSDALFQVEDELKEA
jgi:hypothetical protein